MRRGAKLLAAASGAAIYAAWRLWRTRRTAFDWGELPEGVELLEDMDDAVGCLAAAWTGTADADPERGFDWMLGPELAAKDDPERLRLLAWCQRFFLGLAGASGGAVLAVRRGGDVVAAVGVVPTRAACRAPSATCSPSRARSRRSRCATASGASPRRASATASGRPGPSSTRRTAKPARGRTSTSDPWASGRSPRAASS